MHDRAPHKTVLELQQRGVLLVEDGNHGEYRPRSDEFANTGTAFIRAADMDDGRVLFHSASTINDVALARIRKGIGRPGDILISHKGTVGKVAIVPRDAPPFVCSPQTTFWRTLDEDVLDRRFLYAYMRSRPFHERLASLKGETDMADYVSLTTQRTLTVPLPTIGQQRAIGTMLGALDDKIELNRRTNETLEAMALALFKSWFVDPLSAGATPAGWSAGALPDYFEVNPRRTLRRGDDSAYLDMRNMPTTGHRVVGWERREGGSGMRFQNGDTLVARITPCLENGKTAFVDFLRQGEVACGSTEYIVLRPRPPLPDAFAYYLARSEEFRTFLIQNMTGTSGRQRVPSSCLAQYSIRVPPPSVTLRFGKAVSLWMQTIRAQSEQSATLRELRDLLLPRLLSGELRVRDAERAIEAAL